MMMEYKVDVRMKVDALAASPAFVIDMAGMEVRMSPVGMMMLHNPMTIVIGDSKGDAEGGGDVGRGEVGDYPEGCGKAGGGVYCGEFFGFSEVDESADGV